MRPPTHIINSGALRWALEEAGLCHKETVDGKGELFTDDPEMEGRGEYHVIWILDAMRYSSNILYNAPNAKQYLGNFKEYYC